MRMFEWIRQHNGVVLDFSSWESVGDELESDIAQGEEGHEAHTNTKMEDELNDNDMDDEDDEDEDSDSDDEWEMDSDGEDDETIPFFGPEVVAPKKTWTEGKMKDPVLTNVVGLESYAVEDIQPLQQSSRPKRKQLKKL